MIRPCPRCFEDFDDRYPAASRAVPDRDIEVCSGCGSDEAVGRGVAPFAEWPLGPNREVVW